MVFPEPRRFGLERIDGDEEFQLRQRGRDLLAVGESKQRVEALAEIPIQLSLEHEVEGTQNIVRRKVELGQIAKGKVILWRRRRTPHGFLEAHEELPIVLPIARLVGAQRFETAG